MKPCVSMLCFMMSFGADFFLTIIIYVYPTIVTCLCRHWSAVYANSVRQPHSFYLCITGNYFLSYAFYLCITESVFLDEGLGTSGGFIGYFAKFSINIDQWEERLVMCHLFIGQKFRKKIPSTPNFTLYLKTPTRGGAIFRVCVFQLIDLMAKLDVCEENSK